MSSNVVITANSAWYIANFRDGLVDALRGRGLTPILIAPPEMSGSNEAPGQVPVQLDRSGTNPMRDAGLVASYVRAFRRYRPAAAFSFTIKPNIYAAIAGRFLGIPVIPTVTGLGTVFIRGGPLMRLVERMYRFAFKRCPVVFFENRQDLDTFVERWLIDISQARLVPGCGVNLARFAPAPLPAGRVRFLMIARLLRDKGLVEYVEAVRMLRDRGIEADFQLLGPIDGGNRTAIGEDELNGWVREGLIDYLGETEDVRPHIAAATVVVLPSYREGLPRSLLEGAAMGRPLIATDVPGCREVVDDRKNGLLCDVRSPGSLADAMERLATMTSEELDAMGRAGRAKVVRSFDEKAVVQAYMDVLDCHGLAGLSVPPSSAHRGRSR